MDIPGLPARKGALKLLDAVLRRGETLDVAANAALLGVKGQADRALARALAGEALRWLTDLDAMIDSAILDLQRLVARAPNDIAGRTVLAQALIARGIRRQQADHSAQASSDWQDAAAQLQAIAPASQDPRVLAPWVIAHLLQDKSEAVRRHVRRLDDIGYRHPEFMALRKQLAMRTASSQHDD